MINLFYLYLITWFFAIFLGYRVDLATVLIVILHSSAYALNCWLAELMGRGVDLLVKLYP